MEPIIIIYVFVYKFDFYLNLLEAKVLIKSYKYAVYKISYQDHQERERQKREEQNKIREKPAKKEEEMKVMKEE